MKLKIKFLIFLFILIWSCIVGAISTRADSLVVYPMEDTLPSEWLTDGCTDDYDCIDDPIGSPDDGTTFLKEKTLNDEVHFHLQDVSATIGSGTVDSVLAYGRGYGDEVSLEWEGYKIGVAIGTDVSWSSCWMHGTWTTKRKKFDNAPDAGSWTTTKLDNTKGCLIDCYSVAANKYVYVTQYYMVVYYTPSEVTSQIIIISKNEVEDEEDNLFDKYSCLDRSMLLP